MKKKLETLCNLSLDVYYIASVLLTYCKKQKYDEEMAKIYPIMDLLYDKADNLCFKINEFEIEIQNHF